MNKSDTTIAKTESTLAAPEISPEVMEKVLIGSDLSGLNPAQRLEYYKALCLSLELNPLTRPFEYITLDGKMVLYARKDCTDQVRKRDGVAIKIINRTNADGLYIVTACGTNAAGREDESIGVESMIEPEYVKEWSNQERKKVWVPNPRANEPLPPAERAVAMMKAETKAKRRVTLSLGGLGMADESEIESIEGEGPTKQAEEMKQLADRKEAAAGPVVKVLASEKPGVSTSILDWKKVVPHIGGKRASFCREDGITPKPLGELPSGILQWLYEKWLPEATNSKQDQSLAAAVRLIPPEDREGIVEAPPGPLTAETKATPPHEPPKPAEAAKKRKATPAKEPEKLADKQLAQFNEAEKIAGHEAPMAWREVVMHAECAAKGKTIYEILATERGDIAAHPKVDGAEWLANIHKRLVPDLEKSAEVKDKILANAIKAAVEETGAMLNTEDLRKMLSAKFTDEQLRAAFGNDIETLAEADDDSLRVIARNQPSILAKVKEAK